MSNRLTEIRAIHDKWEIGIGGTYESHSHVGELLDLLSAETARADAETKRLDWMLKFNTHQLTRESIDLAIEDTPHE